MIKKEVYNVYGSKDYYIVEKHNDSWKRYLKIINVN